MNKKAAVKKVVRLMSKFDITTQNILDYCTSELRKQTKEIEGRIQQLKTKGVIVK